MSRRWEWGALAALVLVSTGLRAWAALDVSVPWIAPDEMVYGLLGRSLYEHGSLEILGGPTPFYSLLTPVLTGFPLSAFGLDSGYDVLQGLQAFVMSLAAVPVYLWGRSLVSRRAALAAAALTLATPALVYSGLLMTEVVFYPLLVVAAWAGAEALARPTLHTQALAVVAVAAASATRIQAIVLLPALATAALVDCALARSWSNLRRLAPAAAGLGALVVGWIAWRLGSGSGTLGGYEVIASTSYSVGDAARFVLYHAASLLILCGLFPAAAVALLLVGGLRRGEPDARIRAYLAVASSLSVWLVIEVGVFASRYSDRIVERNLIGLAPMLFLGLVLWLERGAPGSYVERSAVALLATVVLVLLPVDRYVNIFGTHDAMTLIPLYKLSTATSLDALQSTYPAVAGGLAVVLAFLPRSRLRWLPVVLVLALAAASVVSSRFVAEQARAQQARFLGDDPRWVDHSADGSVAYVYDGDPDWPGVWETLFWNPRIDRVFVIGDYAVPGPLPQAAIGLEPDGRVTRPIGTVRTPQYAVASTRFTFVGRPVTQITQQGLRQGGLGLWQVSRPLRISTWTTGTQGNGDIFAGDRAQVAAFDCTRGQFRLTLLIKEPETVDLLLDGRVVRRLTFRSPPPDGGVWRGTVPVLSHTRTRPCFLQVVPSALLGTTVLTFERGVVESAR
jgi:dolichyl-phosphate-mannose-protein mannosyltransferase